MNEYKFLISYLHKNLVSVRILTRNDSDKQFKPHVDNHAY